MKQSFLLRLPEDQMMKVKRAAKDSGISLNEFISRKINDSLEPQTFMPQFNELLAVILKSDLSADFRSVILFGSVATGNAMDSSDLDLLIVLDSNIPIRRSLYKLWQDQIEPEITSDVSGGRTVSPHFVHIPDSTAKAHSLWLEIAVSGVVLWRKSNEIDRWIYALRTEIASGLFQRKFTHGHPYWVRNGFQDDGETV
jgi:predicted nucleotidyltransferase